MGRQLGAAVACTIPGASRGHMVGDALNLARFSHHELCHRVLFAYLAFARGIGEEDQSV